MPQALVAETLKFPVVTISKKLKGILSARGDFYRRFSCI